MEAAVGSLFAPLMGTVVSTLVGGLMGGKPKESAPAPIPTVAPPTAMPDPLAQKAQARRKAAVFDSQRMGAADTVLTGGSDKLGA